MEAAVKGRKVLILDRESARAERVAVHLRGEGYEPLLFADARLAFAHAFRAAGELAAAVIECDGGRERGLVGGLRILCPDVPIFTGLAGCRRLDREPAPAWVAPAAAGCRA